MPRRRKRAVAATGKWWSDTQKLEAASLWAATRSPTTVCAVYGIPMPTFKKWTTQQWWKDTQLQLQQEDLDQLDVKMSKIVHKTMEQLADRVENGNFVFNQKTGGTQRIPISAREATKVVTDLMHQKKVIRDNPTKEEVSVDQAARLLKLAEEFRSFAKAKTIEGSVIDATKST